VASAAAQSVLDRYTFNAGGGEGIGRGDVATFVGNSFQFTAGAGKNFNRFHHLFGADLEYMYYSLPFKSSVVDLGLGDAKAHMQSISLDGIVNVPRHFGKLGAYGIFGLGFYDRSVSLAHAQSIGYNTFYEPAFIWWDLAWLNNLPGTHLADQMMSSHSALAGGVNYGGGLTYRLGDSRAKLYLEWRHHKAYTRDVNGSGARNIPTIVEPITLGVRW
jgi:hypothetical protein